MTIPAVLVCDEGPGVGLGHRRRCEAVAAELRTVGFSPAIVAAGRGVIAAPVVVVDSYRFRADDRKHFVPDVVVAIDDLDRDLDVDILVLPAPGVAMNLGEREAPQRLTRDRLQLAGAKFSLIDQAMCAVESVPITDAVQRVFVTMGAADAAGIGADIAADLAAGRGVGGGIDVRLVVGQWGSDTVPMGVTGVFGQRSLVDELAHADIVVTAGGVTLLESLAMGRPTVVVPTAANQNANVAACVAAGAAVEANATSAATLARALMYDTAHRASIGAAGRLLIDGRGAQRVAATLAERAAAMCGVAS